MATVMIYQFEVYDIQSDQTIKSRRWGTAEAIKEIACGRTLEDTAIEVDESVVASDIPTASPSGTSTLIPAAVSKGPSSADARLSRIPASTFGAVDRWR